MKIDKKGEKSVTIIFCYKFHFQSFLSKNNSIMTILVRDFIHCYKIHWLTLTYPSRTYVTNLCRQVMSRTSNLSRTYACHELIRHEYMLVTNLSVVSRGLEWTFHTVEEFSLEYFENFKKIFFIFNFCKIWVREYQFKFFTVSVRLIPDFKIFIKKIFYQRFQIFYFCSLAGTKSLRVTHATLQWSLTGGTG